MPEKQPSQEQLLLELEKLRQQVEVLQQEKADLEILLETTTIHADVVQALLQESNQKLQGEILERQRTQVVLESLLTKVSGDKADLEIILEMTTAHSDTLEDWLRNQCIRDPLTGLFNRRYMEDFLHRELYHAQVHELPLGIIMGDIDHFKQFNDTFGHEAGDIVLKEVSIVLEKYTNNRGIACRYGGEELILILPETRLEETWKHAELLRQEVKELQVSYQKCTLGRITLSLGIAGFPEHGQSSNQIILLADTALYQAKSQGRDRVVIADV